MRLKLGAAAAAIVFTLPVSTGSALAFDHDRNCAREDRAAYATVARRVMVRPGYRRVVTTPAVYGTRTDRVMVAPRRVVYEPRVIPAVYRDVTRHVVVRPAAVRHVSEPAVYQDVARRVIVAPAARRVIEHPAVIGVRHDRVLVGTSTGGGSRWGHRWARSEVPLWGYGAPRHHPHGGHGGWHQR